MEKKESPLSREEYIKHQMQLMAIGRLAKELRLEEFLMMINEAEAVAPTIDPTLWRKGADNVAAIKALAKTIIPVREAFDKLFQAVVKTEATKQMEKHN